MMQFRETDHGPEEREDWKEHVCNPTRVKHPFNDRDERRGHGIGRYIGKCRCGRYWLIYFERGDDSWDLPENECLGFDCPLNDYNAGERKGRRALLEELWMEKR